MAINGVKRHTEFDELTLFPSQTTARLALLAAFFFFHLFPQLWSLVPGYETSNYWPSKTRLLVVFRALDTLVSFIYCLVSR